MLIEAAVQGQHSMMASGRVLPVPEIGIGGASRLLPSHTTVHTGPYTAVRRIERTPVPAGGVTAGFGSVYRRGRFGPCITAPSGLTLRTWRAGRALPVFCRMAPSRCAFLLPTSIRSGLRRIAPPN